MDTNEVQVSDIEITEESGLFLAKVFNQFSKKSTESIIEMGRIIVVAKKLTATEQDRFYSGIKFDTKSKSIVKLTRIGNNADLLTKFIDYLPSNWTTIYTLTQLNETQLNDLAAEGLLNQSLTGANAEAIVSKLKNKRQSGSIQNQKNKHDASEAIFPHDSFCLAIQFESMPSYELANELRNLLESFKQRTKSTLLLSRVIEDLLEQLPVESEA